MNAIRAIHPDRHGGLWVFDEGQRSAISGHLSAFSGGTRRHAEPEEGCRTMWLAKTGLASAEPKHR
jgi:hypothetical protein